MLYISSRKKFSQGFRVGKLLRNTVHIYFRPKSDVIFIAVPTPPQADGSVDLSFIEKVARDIAAAMTDLQDHRGQKHRAGQNRRKGRRNHQTLLPGKGGFRRGEQSGVPARRLRRRRFDETRPRGHRRPLPAARRRHEGNLHAVQRADCRHRHQFRRTHQARLEFIPRAQNFLHQRHRRHLRGRRRERAGSRRRHGPGRTHRPPVSQRRHRLRRQLFPKDLSAFIKIAEQNGYDFRLLKEVQRINADQMERFVKKITDTLWVLKDKTIGVLGLAFKQNTDDIRMSPAIELCQRLQKEGANVARA